MTMDPTQVSGASSQQDVTAAQNVKGKTNKAAMAAALAAKGNVKVRTVDELRTQAPEVFDEMEKALAMKMCQEQQRAMVRIKNANRNSA